LGEELELLNEFAFLGRFDGLDNEHQYYGSDSDDDIIEKADFDKHLQPLFNDTLEIDPNELDEIQRFELQDQLGLKTLKEFLKINITDFEDEYYDGGEHEVQVEDEESLGEPTLMRIE